MHYTLQTEQINTAYRLVVTPIDEFTRQVLGVFKQIRDKFDLTEFRHR